MLIPAQSCTKCEITYPNIPRYKFTKAEQIKEFKYMRALNRSLIVLLAATSSLTLSGCLGTNTPTLSTPAIYESANGSTFVATRGAGYEDILTSGTGTAGTVGNGGNGALTAFTNGTSGATGFTLLAPLDPNSVNPAAFTATMGNGQFTTVSGAGNIFVGAQQSGTAGSSKITNSNANDILVDKFGVSKSLQDTEYGVWTESTTTAAGLSNTAATTAGVFAVGIPTTIMPTTGTATYTGGAAGIATNATTGGEFAGTALLSANFGTGAITGVITGPGGTIGAPTAVPFAPAGGTTTVGTMNAISFSAGTIAGNTFAGTAAAAAGAGTGINITGSSGNFGGTFNGVNAAEVAGTFKVTGGGSTAAVIGSFGAKQ